ncbi:hypothetical protein AB0D73_22830 [Streptomyces sp. NPDC048215]|uniref:hypothetical protein n=1 Tax=Streptomyces TaxID=1883 RepID=UPI002E14AFB4|nr:hypothetical protein OG483_22975 [[Kitasatospora] papulosa]
MPAQRITVTRAGHRACVVVDGVEIPPNAIGRHSVTVPVDPDEPPSVQLTLIGAHVEVLNTLKEGATDGTAE